MRSMGCAVMLVWASASVANPTGPQVAAGQATFQAAGNTLTIGNTPGTIINWQGFSIGAGELTRFRQQSAASAVLNRVTGADLSSILGTLSSNGRVFLVNPNGIVFGAGSRIDTAGFIASTLNIRDEDFLSGRLRFEGGGQGVLRNEGAIRASGDIFLVGPQVENAGLIRSEAGSVLLAAGQSVTITSPDAHGVQFALQAPSDTALNLGTIEAANAAGLFAGTLRHSGEIRATSASVDASGRIVLAARQDAIVDGNASISVDNTAGKGGSVQITGARVGLFDTVSVSARGASGGGEILVGGGHQGTNPDVRNAAMTHVGSDARLDAGATVAGDGGRIIVWADDTARVHGAIAARGGAQGGDGGFIETSGKRHLDVAGIRIDAGGATGGTWLLDPLDIVIVAGAGTVNNSGPSAFTPGGSSSQIGADLIVTQLDAGTSVTLNTNVAGGDAGDITISAPIVKTATSASSLTLTANNNIAVNEDITLPAGAASTFTATASGSFTVNDATVLAETINVTAASIGRSGTQANDFRFGRPPSSTFGTLNLTTTGAAAGSAAEPLRFVNTGDPAGRSWSVNTSAAGTGGHVHLRYTGSGISNFGTGVITDAATSQTVSIDHIGTGTFAVHGAINSNDDWMINGSGNYGFAGATLTARSMTVNLAGAFGRLGIFPLIPYFDTSAFDGDITLTADQFDGTGAGGSQVGVGVRPGAGTVTATSTGSGVGGGGTAGSIQLMHFGGDLRTSQYDLNFTGGTAGAFMRLKAADGHLIVDSTAGFDASLNNKETLLQTLAAGRDIIFDGGTVQGGRVEVRATGNIDNLAPGTNGFIQTNAFGGAYWKVHATGGGIGLTNPVEGTAETVGDLVSGGVGALGDINVKFNAGAGAPSIATAATHAGSAQNISITTVASLGFAPGQPGYGGLFSTANDHYTMNVGGSMFFTMFNDTATAASFDLTVAGSALTNTCCGTAGRWISTTGPLSIISTGGTIGTSTHHANLPGSGGMTLSALSNIFLDAGANPLTLAGLTTGPAVGTIGLRTTAANDLIFSGTTNINDALVLNIGGDIIFPAAADFTTSGGLGLNSPTQIAATASVNVTGGTFTATQPITNAGTLSSSIVGNTTLAAAFHNTGTLDVNAGTVNLAGGGTSTGAFDAAPGATINFSGGTHNLGDGSTLSGGGAIGYTGGTLNLNGSGAGTTVATGTTLVATGQTFGGAGKLVNQGAFNVASSTVSGAIDNQGMLNAAGSSAVNGAFDLTSGTLNLVAGGTLTKGGGAADWIGGTIIGTGTYTGGLAFSGGGARVFDGPTLSVADLSLPSGSLEVVSGVLSLSGSASTAAGSTLLLSGGTLSSSGTLANAGAFTMAWAGAATIAGAFTNTGTMNANAGALDFAGGYTQTAGSTVLRSGAVSGNVVLDGGVLRGIGTITGNVDNIGGSLAAGASPGTLTIDGDFTQGPGGALEIELGGNNQGVDYDLLQVTGTANLGGTLNVRFFGGFTATAGDTFDVITYASRTGDFTTFNQPSAATMNALANASFYRLAMTIAPASGGGAGTGLNVIAPAAIRLAQNEATFLNDEFIHHGRDFAAAMNAVASRELNTALSVALSDLLLVASDGADGIGGGRLIFANSPWGKPQSKKQSADNQKANAELMVLTNEQMLRNSARLASADSVAQVSQDARMAAIESAKERGLSSFEAAEAAKEAAANAVKDLKAEAALAGMIAAGKLDMENVRGLNYQNALELALLAELAAQQTGLHGGKGNDLLRTIDEAGKLDSIKDALKGFDPNRAGSDLQGVVGGWLVDAGFEATFGVTATEFQRRMQLGEDLPSAAKPGRGGNSDRAGKGTSGSASGAGTGQSSGTTPRGSGSANEHRPDGSASAPFGGGAPGGDATRGGSRAGNTGGTNPGSVPEGSGANQGSGAGVGSAGPTGSLTGGGASGAEGSSAGTGGGSGDGLGPGRYVEVSSNSDGSFNTTVFDVDANGNRTNVGSERFASDGKGGFVGSSGESAGAGERPANGVYTAVPGTNSDGTENMTLVPAGRSGGQSDGNTDGGGNDTTAGGGTDSSTNADGGEECQGESCANSDGNEQSDETTTESADEGGGGRPNPMSDGPANAAYEAYLDMVFSGGHGTRQQLRAIEGAVGGHVTDPGDDPNAVGVGGSTSPHLDAKNIHLATGGGAGGGRAPREPDYFNPLDAKSIFLQSGGAVTDPPRDGSDTGGTAAAAPMVLGPAPMPGNVYGSGAFGAMIETVRIIQGGQ